jgi:hypothetical protein
MFALEQPMKTKRGNRLKLYYFFNLGAIKGWVVDATPWPIYPWERDPVPFV